MEPCPCSSNVTRVRERAGNERRRLALACAPAAGLNETAIERMMFAVDAAHPALDFGPMVGSGFVF
jgi:hypothetical protein